MTHAALRLLTVAFLLAAGLPAFAAETELQRARRELADAERNLERILDAKSRAREAYDRTKAIKGEAHARLEGARFRFAELRQAADNIARDIADSQMRHDRLAGDTALMARRARELNDRVVATRRYVDETRGRFIRDFEASPTFRTAADDVARAQARADQARNEALRDLDRNPRYRWAEADIRFYESEIARLRARRTDPRQIEEAQRALDEARKAREDMVSQAVTNDAEVIGASARLVDAKAAFDDLRARFSADLDRRREIRDALASLAEQERAHAAQAAALAQNEGALNAFRRDLDRQKVMLVNAERGIAPVQADVDRFAADLERAGAAFRAAEADYARIGAAEDEARANLDRAQRRLDFFERNRDRGNDRVPPDRDDRNNDRDRGDDNRNNDRDRGDNRNNDRNNDRDRVNDRGNDRVNDRNNDRVAPDRFRRPVDEQPQEADRPRLDPDRPADFERARTGGGGKTLFPTTRPATQPTTRPSK